MGKSSKLTGRCIVKGIFASIMLGILLTLAPEVSAAERCFYVFDPGNLGPRMQEVVDYLEENLKPQCGYRSIERDTAEGWGVSFDFPTKDKKGKFIVMVTEIWPDGVGHYCTPHFWEVGTFFLEEKNLDQQKNKIFKKIHSKLEDKPDGNLKCFSGD